MVEVIENLTAIGNLADFTSLQNSFSSLVMLFQILGGLLGIYLIYWTITLFINARKMKTLNKILEKLDEINKKLEKLTKNKK